MTAPLLRWARKSGITVAGLSMLAGGAVMLVLPGPGLAVILLGLAVLSAEYAWAARLLAHARQYASRIAKPVRARWRRGRSPENHQRRAGEDSPAPASRAQLTHSAAGHR
jgi:uncharacterized protein (TIGR02611 family)